MDWLLGIGVVVAVWFGYLFVQGWKDGGSVGKTTKPRSRRRGATVPRGDVLKVIREAGGKGIGRAAIIEKLDVKGDKTAENSVTYQLRELKEGRRVRHEGRRYFAR